MQTQQAQTAPSALPFTAADAEPCQLQQIPTSVVGEVVPIVLPLLEAIVARSDGRYSVPGMLEQFARGNWQLWIVWDGSVRAIVATELYHDVSKMKCCTIRFATGRGAAGWSPLISQIEDWARDQGCVKIDMTARKGWARHLPAYKLSHVFLEKGL